MAPDEEWFPPGPTLGQSIAGQLLPLLFAGVGVFIGWWLGGRWAGLTGLFLGLVVGNGLCIWLIEEWSAEWVVQSVIVVVIVAWTIVALPSVWKRMEQEQKVDVRGALMSDSINPLDPISGSGDAKVRRPATAAQIADELAMIAALEESMEDFEQGHLIPHAEVMKKIERRLQR
jgi:hypothetical protein